MARESFFLLRAAYLPSAFRCCCGSQSRLAEIMSLQSTTQSPTQVTPTLVTRVGSHLQRCQAISMLLLVCVIEPRVDQYQSMGGHPIQASVSSSFLRRASGREGSSGDQGEDDHPKTERSADCVTPQLSRREGRQNNLTSFFIYMRLPHHGSVGKCCM